MRPSRALLLVPLLSLAACGGSPGPEPDAGAPDAGVPDAGAPDAGPPDAGAPDAGRPDAGGPPAQACDAGQAPQGVPQLTGRIYVVDGGVAPFVPAGDTFGGTWGAVNADVYLPYNDYTRFIDPAGSSVERGTHWIAVRADGGYAQAIDVVVNLATIAGPRRVTYAAQSYGAVEVGTDGGLTLTPACGRAPELARYAHPGSDGGTQLLVRVPLDGGSGMPPQHADIVMDLVPLQP